MMHEEDDLEDEYQVVQDPSFCCFGGCFGLFSRNNDCYEHKYLVLQQGGEQDAEITWWWKNLNKAKQCTELLGGPKWKNFIRKVGGYCRNMKEKHKNRLSKNQKQRNTRFQYDLQSYALNFDNGREGADTVLDFAARFSAPMSKEHCSIDRPVQQTDVQLP